MEDLSTKRNQNVANPDSSSSRDESEGITKEIEEVISIEIGDEASNERSGGSQSHQKRRRIERVPPIMRRDKRNKRYYYPQVVSLGPYHHGKKKLKLVEDFKPSVLQMFVSESGKDRDDLYNAVLEVIDDARSCYVQGSTDAYNDDAFANMMLLDGCFILFFIDCYINNRQSLGMLRNHLDSLTVNIAETDMFLIENQLPFQVLQVLMRLKFKENRGKEMIDRFIETVCSWTLVFNVIKPEAKDDEPFHLYQALRTRLLLSSRGEEVNQPGHEMSSSSYSLWDRLIRNNFYQVELNHTFRFLRRKKSDVNDHLTTIDYKEYIQSFRSVIELKAKGIFVRPSSTYSLRHVKFKSYWFYGQLELPWCFINSSSKIAFLNGVAYEMCPKNPNDRGITCYVAFMKSLIDHPDDVKELRSKRIIFNMLGSDEEVVQIFKEINLYDMENLVTHRNVRDSIHKHYNSKARTWMAELYFTYFSSPWKTIALFGVIFLLVLSVLQTYFSWKALYPHK